MKHIFTFLFLCLLSTSGNTQVGLDWPDSNATWVIGLFFFVDWDEPLHLENTKWFSMNGEDTLIDGLEYTKVMRGDSYYGAIRDSVGVQYFMPSLEEETYLLHNFNAEIGDTLYNVYDGHNEAGTFVVTDKDTINYYGVNRRTIELSDGPIWIEGIGSEDGLFQTISPGVSGITQCLCMSFNDTIFWNRYGFNYELGSCADYMTVEDQFNDLKLTVYPNPSSGVFTVEPESEMIKLVDFSISDVAGKQIMNKSISMSNRFEIDLSNYPNGAYFLTISSEGNVSQKILYKTN